MKNKLIIGIICSVMTIIPFVAADIKAGPETFAIPIIGIALLGGFIVGAIFLIRWIIKKIRAKE